MPNGVKYSTTTPTGSFSKSNVAIGVSGSLGPTANTGFYSMPTPQSGKYIINKVASSGVPLFFAPQNDTELIQFAKQEGATGANTGSASAVLAWISTQPNLLATNTEYPSNFPNIVVDGLVYYVDAGLTTSYPGSGTSWNDTSGNGSNGTLTNGPTFNSANSGSIVFDGIDDYCQFSSLPPGFQAGMTNYSISIWFKLNAAKEAPLLEMGTINGDLQRVMFWLTGGNPNRLYALGASLNSQYRYSSVSLTTGNFYNAVYTYNNTGTISKLYINGVEDTGLTNSTANGLLATINNSWAIGGDNVYSHSYCQSTNIYNVLLHIKTLSSSEVTQNYNAQKGRFGL
jgi:hypothetical protein